MSLYLIIDLLGMKNKIKCIDSQHERLDVTIRQNN